MTPGRRRQGLIWEPVTRAETFAPRRLGPVTAGWKPIITAVLQLIPVVMVTDAGAHDLVVT
jgi:hypothetical protein